MGEEDPLTLDIPELGEVALGEELKVSGAFAFETTSDPDVGAPSEIAGAEIPKDCRGYDVFVAV